MVRFGIIGCGDIAKIRYLPCFRYLRNVELLAVCRRSNMVKKIAEEWGAKWYYTEYQELLENPFIDAVIVATPPIIHPDIITAAAKAGKHVLSEKPMALNLKDTKKIVEEAKKRKIKFMPLPYDPYYPNYMKAKEVLRRGYIGEPVAAESSMMHCGPIHASWFFKKGSGVLNDLGVYPISCLTSLLGPASKVSAITSIVLPERTLRDGSQIKAEVEDNVILILKWDRGVLGTVLSNFSTGGLGKTLVSGLPRGGSIYATTIYGKQGVIYLESRNRLVICSESREIPKNEVGYFKGIKGWAPSLPSISRLDRDTRFGSTIISHFVHCILADKEPLPNGEHQIHVIEIIEKAYRSVETGHAQKLETTFGEKMSTPSKVKENLHLIQKRGGSVLTEHENL